MSKPLKSFVVEGVTEGGKILVSETVQKEYVVYSYCGIFAVIRRGIEFALINLYTKELLPELYDNSFRAYDAAFHQTANLYSGSHYSLWVYNGEYLIIQHSPRAVLFSYNADTSDLHKITTRVAHLEAKAIDERG